MKYAKNSLRQLRRHFTSVLLLLLLAKNASAEEIQAFPQLKEFPKLPQLPKIEPIRAPESIKPFNTSQTEIEKSKFYPVQLSSAQQNNVPCKDPWKDTSWYKVVGNEIYDFKQLVVWFRCPALYTENFKCSAENTLPSENFESARKIPKWAPNANWRLPTIRELDRVVAKKCDYQFPSDLIELPPAPLWTSTKYQGGYMKLNETGEVYLDGKNELAWTIYLRDFSIKEMLQERDKISSNIIKLSEDDISVINKKIIMKLTKIEIFFEDEMSRVQSDNDCYADMNQMIFSVSCKLKDGSFTSSKFKIDCQGKKGNSFTCISETLDSTNKNLIGNTVRADIELNDNSLKLTSFPIYKGGSLMPYKIESSYSIAR